MNQPTAREQLLNALCDPTESDADILGLPEDEANRLLDAYRAEVLATFSQTDARDVLDRHQGETLRAAAARVLTLPTANQNRYIAATRNQIVAAVQDAQ